jgi:hypothetical protein
MNPLSIVTSVRQNHALEHATVHVLTRHNPYLRLVGRSTSTGFYIYGPVDTQELANAATEALARLQQGESNLAVHPRCGTNLAVTGLLAGVAAFGATLGRPRNRLDRLPVAIIAATLAAVAAQPLAYTVQERVTTSPDLDGVYVRGIDRSERGGIVIHKVSVGRV